VHDKAARNGGDQAGGEDGAVVQAHIVGQVFVDPVVGHLVHQIDRIGHGGEPGHGLELETMQQAAGAERGDYRQAVT